MAGFLSVSIQTFYPAGHAVKEKRFIAIPGCSCPGHDAIQDGASKGDAIRDDGGNMREGLPMSGSRAKRAAAMIEAAMTNVDANRSCFCFSAFSRVIARRISPNQILRSARNRLPVETE
jgi:hypothetical protein